jgi:Immunoglobulin domain
MKTSKSFRSLPFALAALLSFPHGTHGEGTVTNATLGDFQAALGGGGLVQFACNGTITLTNTIIIGQDTRLDATGYSVTLSGGNRVRLIQVNSNVSLSIKSLTVADGQFIATNAPNGDPAPPGPDGFGAGIVSLGGTVALTGCTLTNNFVQGGNAGQDSSGHNTGHGGKALGAALCNFGGQVNLTNCVLAGNGGSGGLGSARIVFPQPAYEVGDGGDALGGSIYSDGGSIVLQGVTLSNNRTAGGQGLPGNNFSSLGGGGNALGGALFAQQASVAIASSVFANNTAMGGAESTLYIASAGAGGGDALGGALFIAGGGSAIIQVSQFTSNSAAGGSGNRLVLAGLARGGAVFNAGTMQLWNSLFSGNSTAGGGGCVYPGIAQGGGLFSSNSLAVAGCTFDSNSSVGGDASGETPASWPGAAGEGGAIWSAGTFGITNSTLSGNMASGGAGGGFLSRGPGGAGSGGGLAMVGASAQCVNLTIAGNGAKGGASPTQVGPAQGGSLYTTGAVVTVQNSILANSQSGGEVVGTVTDNGYNLCSDGTANFSAPGSLNNIDPKLSALSYNGGPTPTMSLVVGSPARDAVPSGFPAQDQRGVSRPQGPAGDIGAFEADFVSSPPTIGTPPQGMTVRAGTNVTFTLTASGTPPLSYQWRKNGNPLSMATNTALSLTNVQAADAATYSVVVTNSGGSTPSAGAILVVDSTPLILAGPSSVVVSPGASTNFVVSADGPAITYQWSHNSSVVPGATGAVLSIGSAMAGAQGDYFAVVSNFAGVATSIVATLTFDASALNILVPPKDQTVESGYSASFSVVVSGIPPLTYQWQHKGTPVAGATLSSLTLPTVHPSDAGSYVVVVTNGYRSVTSTAAVLTITPGAVPPTLQLGKVGGNLTITFNGEAGRAYRLLVSSNLLSWSSVATNATVSSGPVQFVRPLTAAPGGFYRVVTP